MNKIENSTKKTPRASKANVKRAGRRVTSELTEKLYTYARKENVQLLKSQALKQDTSYSEIVDRMIAYGRKHPNIFSFTGVRRKVAKTGKAA